MSGLIRALREIIEPQADPAQDRRITRRPVQRLFDKVHQPARMERGGQSLEPHARHRPVPVAARAAHQIELAPRAFEESRAQFGKKRLIIASRHRQLRIYRIAKISHVVDGGP